jgi:cytochrome c biogenesis protein
MAKHVWRFFTSIRLTLVLIVIIISLSLVGIFLIQAPPPISPGSPEYTRWLENVVRPDFGIWTYTLAFFGLFHIFRSPLFPGAGILLMFNILCCIINRWRAIKSTFHRSNIPANPDYYQNAPLIYQTLSSTATAVSSVTSILMRYHYNVRTKKSGSSTYISADKYRYSPAGTVISHLSLILLFIGLLLGNFLGFHNDNLVVSEGTVQEVGYNTGLSLRLLSFTTDYWDGGIPRDYRSEVIIYKDGQQITSDIIRVNHPLTYSGVHFYQSFYGPAVKIKVQTTDTIEISNNTVALVGTMQAEPFQRPIGKLILQGTGFTAYLIAPAINTFDPILAENQLGIELYQGESNVPLSWAILDKGVSQDINDMEFTYLENKSFSGFTVKSDPGIWLIWLAFGLFFAGIVMVLFLPLQQTRVMIQPDDEGVTIYVRYSGKRGPNIKAELEKFNRALDLLIPGRLIAGEGVFYD